MLGVNVVGHIDVDAQKTEAIKEVRNFCKLAFGVEPGLKETKEFMDTLARSNVMRRELKRVVASAMESIDADTIMAIVREATTGVRY